MNPRTQRVILVLPGRLERHIAHAWDEAHAENRRRVRAAREEAARVAEEAAAAARAQAERERAGRCPRPEKYAWGTREVAELQLVQMRGKGRDPDHTLSPYLCGCGAWHIGNVTHAKEPARCG
jgi:hypothetical protein